ncbi:hypothetical protein MKZ38_004549 [Zalerion maritima]|uniref:Uncharacterized protein n=1 Tax=Zalerion maritima TaxID=339359 RepID=A0AAD5RM80_9PEZI|nr:hypothetical protein MKZ38_004549 [Zalerion maritima]
MLSSESARRGEVLPEVHAKARDALYEIATAGTERMTKKRTADPTAHRLLPKLGRGKLGPPGFPPLSTSPKSADQIQDNHRFTQPSTVFRLFTFQVSSLFLLLFGLSPMLADRTQTSQDCGCAWS